MAAACLESEAVQLRPHQIRVAKYVQKHRGLLCIHSTGTGKTLTAAAVAACLVVNKVVEHVVVLTKKSAVDQFHAEVMRYWPELPARQLICMTHTLFFDHAAKDVDPGKTLLVVDEAHEFVNPTGVSTQRLEAFARLCKRVLLLTATPIVNGAYDLAPLVAMVKGVDVPSRHEFDAILEDDKSFAAWFAGTVDILLIDKNKNKAYPHVSVKTVHVQMSRETRAEYMKQLGAPAPFYINLRQLSLGVKSNCEKCGWLVQHVKEWIKRGEGKIVVYTAFIERGAAIISKLLADEGINVLVIDGEASAAQRRRSALLFSKHKQEERAEERRLKEDLRKLVVDGDAKKVGTRCGKDGVLATRLGKPGDLRYVEGTGTAKKPASSAIREQVEAMHIPPAWNPAEVCKTDNKIQWVAMDKKGRWQYRYSQDWAVQQEYKKIVRLKAMDAAFWQKYHNVVDASLASGDEVERGLAVAAKLIAACHFRVGGRSGEAEGDGGNDSDSADEPHYGLTTLLRRHVTQRKKSTFIKFVGKSAKENTCEVKDGLLHSEIAWLLKRSTTGKGGKVGDAPLFDGLVDAPGLRAYLHKIRPGLRPKDFRTYYANYVLVDFLRKQPPATALRPSQRTRALASACREAARGLNNTPTVAKNSYIFTGLWVLYQADPKRFQDVVDAGRDKHTADVLDAFIRLFASNAINWQFMLEWFKETRGVAPFLGPAQVLLITDAGSESIDLAGTRHIVFMDPTWTPALEDQIIGRGQRFMSHKHLPPAQRTVTVWKLFLEAAGSSSGKARGEETSPKQGVDRYVSRIVAKKRAEQLALYEKLAKLS